MDNHAVQSIAKIVWEADRGFIEMNSLIEVPHWEDAEEWQREKTCNDVAFLLEYNEATDAALHNKWVEEMRENEWVYGKTFSKEKKTNPNLIDYVNLPIEEKIRYNLLWTIVRKFDTYRRKYKRLSISDKSTKKNENETIKKNDDEGY